MFLKLFISIALFSLIHGRSIINERNDWVTNDIPATNLPGWTTAVIYPTTTPAIQWTPPDLPVTTWGTWTMPASTIEN